MRLLMTASYYQPNISGLTVYVKNLAEELAERKFGVKILTSRYQKKLSFKENVNGVVIERVWTPFLLGRGPVMPTFILNSFLSVYKSDVVNCHLPQFEAVVVAFWAKLLKKKLIVTYHCDLASWPGLINKISVFAAYVSQFLTCLVSDKIVVNSKDYADNSWFLGVFKRKLIYIYPPVRLGKARINVLREWKNINYKVGYVGRIAKEKGVKYLLASIDHLTKSLRGSFKVFLVGPTDGVVGGGSIRELSKFFDNYKDNFVLLGKLPEGKLFGFYKEVDVLVLPSVQSMESFGMVQIEAMLSGCPVVASDLPGVRVPIALTGMGETFPVGNSRLLADRVIKVVANKSRYIKKQKTAKRLFSLKKTIGDYEKMFREVENGEHD